MSRATSKRYLSPESFVPRIFRSVSRLNKPIESSALGTGQILPTIDPGQPKPQTIGPVPMHLTVGANHILTEREATAADIGTSGWGRPHSWGFGDGFVTATSVGDRHRTDPLLAIPNACFAVRHRPFWTVGLLDSPCCWRSPFGDKP
jgi:hypothetical protein